MSSWDKIEEVFQSAVDLSPAERPHFLDQQCGDDEELKKEVEKLIGQYETDEDFLESPVWTDSQMLHSTFKNKIASSIEKEISIAGDSESFAGQRIGAYRLTTELGRGGMGAVYLAERADGEFHQEAAVKLIKRGMDTDFIVRRFRHERQILATLDHPNIARLLDGGTTDNDLPYFVMEFVNGEPLYKYCDEKKLDIRARLRLIRQVCGAVQAAHERQIIHRDIKPGNIIVTKSGIPKLLDFGIAKILDPDLIHESLNPTSTMMRLMTPDYASPEQVRGLEITPVSDVYALGILIYELLTGHRPYNFAGRSPHEVSKVICESEPILPSQAVAKQENLLSGYAHRKMSVEDSAKLRNADISILQEDLSENLDNLILKALCKDPAGRYASVKELSDDISRFLDGRQVLAEPCVTDKASTEKPLHDSHPTGSHSIAVLPFKLLNISNNEDTGDRFLGVGLADALITRLSNVRRFIVRPTSSVLRFGEGNPDPFPAGRELNVEYILDGHIQKFGQRIRVSVQLLNVAENSTVWAQRYNESFTDVLSLEDLISTQVAESLVPHLSLDEREVLSKRGTNIPDAFSAYLHGRYYWNTFTEEGFAKAIVSYNEAIAHDPNYALAYAGIADYYNWLGIYGILPAYECFQAAKEAALKAVALDDKLSEAHAALGFAVVGGDYDWERGEKHCRRALELNPHSATAQVWYSLQLTMEGRFNEGIFHARRGIELDPLSAFNSYNLGWCLYYAHKFDESIEQHQRTITNFPSYFLGYYGLCWALRISGQFKEAIEELQKAAELAGESPFIQTARGQTLAAAGRLEEAETILNELEAASFERFVSPYHTALTYAFLKDKEKTLEFLGKSLETREAWMVWSAVEPAYDFLQGEPRFHKLLEQTNNPVFHRARTIAFVTSEAPSSGAVKAGESSKPVTQSNEETVETPPAPGHSLAQRKYFWLVAAFAVLILVAAAFTFRYIKSPGSNAPQISAASGKSRAIAVLPFKPIGAKFEGDEYLGAGTADLITDKLSHLSQLKLRSSSALRQYLQTDKTPTEIGRELSSDYVVNGTIERTDEKFVKANLVMTDTASGAEIWKQEFVQPTDNLSALQETISQKIAESLGLQLTREEKSSLSKPLTGNNEAYQLYLAGLYHLNKRNSEDFKTALGYFERAVATDQNFAAAYAGLAGTYALMRLYPPAPPNAFEQSREFAEKALKLDESLAEAHAALGLVAFYGDRKFAESEKQLRRATELNPNYAMAHQWLALTLSAESRFDEALSEIEKAEQIDPQSLFIEMAHGNILFYARQHSRAEEIYKGILKRDSGFNLAYVGWRRTLEMQGQYDEAAKVFEQEKPFRQNENFYLKLSEAELAAAANRREDALQAISEAFNLPEAKNEERNQSYYLSTIYALLGDIDQTIKYLRIAEDEKRNEINFINVSPYFDKVRGDKKFTEFRTSVIH